MTRAVFWTAYRDAVERWIPGVRQRYRFPDDWTKPPLIRGPHNQFVWWRRGWAWAPRQQNG
ncbi:MAG: hypothetical protein C0506_09235 [Anaerolinea sp.]|nr:hypothetical protein [Anaerolinea sp.]